MKEVMSSFNQTSICAQLYIQHEYRPVYAQTCINKLQESGDKCLAKKLHEGHNLIANTRD